MDLIVVDAVKDLLDNNNVYERISQSFSVFQSNIKVFPSKLKSIAGPSTGGLG